MNYHNITKKDTLNGEGFRTVLWLAGCEHHCKGCQNPQTWDKNGGLPFNDKAKAEVLDSLKSDIVSGLTLSGGDPLASFNRKEVLSLLKEVRKSYPDKDIWVYTGYLFEDVIGEELLNYIDVLVDGKYEESLRDISLNWRGSKNQRLIDVPNSLKANKTVLFGSNECQLFEANNYCH